MEHYKIIAMTAMENEQRVEYILNTHCNSVSG